MNRPAPSQKPAANDMERWCAVLAGQAAPDSTTESAALLRAALQEPFDDGAEPVDEAAVARMMQRLEQAGAFAGPASQPVTVASPVPAMGEAAAAAASTASGMASRDPASVPVNRAASGLVVQPDASAAAAWGPRGMPHRRALALAAAALALLAVPLALHLEHFGDAPDASRQHSASAGPVDLAKPEQEQAPRSVVGFTRMPIVPISWVFDPAASAQRLVALLQRHGVQVRVDLMGSDYVVQAQLPVAWPRERLDEVQRAIGTDRLDVAAGEPLVVRFAQAAK